MTDTTTSALANSLPMTISFLSRLGQLSVNNLWSDILEPSKSFADIAFQNQGINQQMIDITLTIKEVVVKKKNHLSSEQNVSLSNGRLLVFSPLHSTMDALANAETGGFFDESDAPPWSTWIDAVNFTDVILNNYECYLLCWIPEQFISIAQQGIDVCLGESLFWADDIKEAATYGKNAKNMCENLINGVRVI